MNSIRCFFMYVMLLIAISLSAQDAKNVGIGEQNPSEKLDVNGNINIQGNIVMDGTSGLPGEVLTTDWLGNTIWKKLQKYENVRQFRQDGSFTLPAGVTSIAIEVIGAGGGGAFGGGGGGGTYLFDEFDVNEGETLTLSVGNGGSPANSRATAANSGDNTLVTGSFGTLEARGGGGAGSIYPGSVSTWGGNFSYIQIPGNPGEPTWLEYQERSAGNFVEAYEFGSGGGSYPRFQKHPGGNAIFDNNFTTLYFRIRAPSSGPDYGTGGGGGYVTTSQWGYGGRGGVIYIHY